MRLAIAAIICIGLALPAWAENVSGSVNCADIKDTVKRLECYDSQPKKGVKRSNKKEAANDEKRVAAELAIQERDKLKIEADRASAKAEQELAKAEVAAKDALKSVRRLQAKVQTGISYRDYSPALADAKLEVTMFVESSSGKKLPEVAKLLSRAIGHYDIANSLWKIKFTERYAWLTDKDVTKTLMAMYPEIAASKEERVNLHIEESVMMIWKAASKDIDEATKLLGS
jgi:hypothetical protein